MHELFRQVPSNYATRADLVLNMILFFWFTKTYTNCKVRINSYLNFIYFFLIIIKKSAFNIIIHILNVLSITLTSIFHQISIVSHIHTVSAFRTRRRVSEEPFIVTVYAVSCPKSVSVSGNGICVVFMVSKCDSEFNGYSESGILRDVRGVFYWWWRRA